MKPTKTKIFLYSIFLVTVIPTIAIYIEHTIVEFNAFETAKTETKQIKTFGEGILFFVIGLGYAITAYLIIKLPQWRIPYLIILVGTVAVTILYYFRIYGIPILGTEIVIVDFSSDWRDVITKICQNILVIPVAMLLKDVINKKK